MDLTVTIDPLGKYLLILRGENFFHIGLLVTHLWYYEDVISIQFLNH